MKNKHHNTVYVCLVIITFLSIQACNSTPYKKGERIYNNLCVNCHMEDGSGLNKLIPSLDNLHDLSFKDQTCIIVKGYNADSLGISMRVMPSHESLGSADLTNLVNYINWKWNPSYKEVQLQDMNLFISSCTLNK